MFGGHGHESETLGCGFPCLLVACSGGGKGSGVAARSGNGSGGSSGIKDRHGRGTTGITTCDPTDPSSACGANAPAPPGCGDGMLTSDEACDDGNKVGGDGCAANCLAVEPGFSCNPPGAACHQIARCGDGLVADSEVCDDATSWTATVARRAVVSRLASNATAIQRVQPHHVR